MPSRRYGARVLFLENRDSFSHNLVDYLRALGAEVAVVDQEEAPDLKGFTHLVVGPGPKDPFTAGRVLEWTEKALAPGPPGPRGGPGGGALPGGPRARGGPRRLPHRGGPL